MKERFLKLKAWVLIFGMLISFFTFFSCVLSAEAREYYVDKFRGNDSNPGTKAAPFKTIQKAADIMQPGDTCFIRSGIYRETVRPARGGTSENKRITYKAFPNETPIITGAEQINTWTYQGNGVWKVEIPNSYFGAFNPYEQTMTSYSKSEPWIYYGQWHHLGEVYLNGVAYYEKRSLQEVQLQQETWFTEQKEGKTIIWANFGKNNPNQQLAEINVRESIFEPAVPGLAYLTLDGLTIRQSACNWTPPGSEPFQKAAVTTRWGKAWIIQNCHVSDCKAVGIALANSNEVQNKADLSTFGHHIVRNNIIERCGQGGICGNRNSAVSIIEGNLIQDINYKREYGGEETAGIKFHSATDTIIRNNIIRRVRAGGSRSHPGIWIDYANDGLRITGNVIYETDDSCIYMEANHGPNLIDNNIFIGNVIKIASERNVIVHNLFYNSGILYEDQLWFGEPRSAGRYKKHSGEYVGSSVLYKIGDKYFNNIFINKSFENQPTNPKDYASDYNFYCGTATKSQWDANSVSDSSLNANLGYQNLKNGIKLQFDMNNKIKEVRCPFITSDFIGKFQPMDQSIEEHDGTGIRIDKDMQGLTRNTGKPSVGPLENIKGGVNTYTFTAGINRTPGDLETSGWGNLCAAAHKISATSISSNSLYVLSNAYDNRFTTVYKSADNPNFPQYITMNFRLPQTFNRVALVVDFAKKRGITDFDVEVSENGATGWQKVGGGKIQWRTENKITFTDEHKDKSYLFEIHDVVFPQTKLVKGIRLKINKANLDYKNFAITEMMFDNAGYYRLDTPQNTPSPAPVPFPKENGIIGQYFNNEDLTSLKLKRIDNNINFNWGKKAPMQGMKSDGFSVRWTGALMSHYSGKHTFYITADEGVRFWLDGKLMINKWSSKKMMVWKVSAVLKAGNKHAIKLEYCDRTGESNVRLEWESALQKRQVIPQSSLFIK